MNHFVVNFDYEINLFNNKIKKYSPSLNSKINKKLEFLFLWLENNKTLHSLIDYDPIFLEEIFRLTNHQNTISKKIPSSLSITYWWGEYQPLERMRFLNSKESLWKLLFKKGLTHPDSQIIQRQDIAENEKKMIIKSFYGFSGRGISFGHQSLQSNDQFFITEPFLKRVMDISWVNTPQKKSILINDIDDNFQYCGSLYNPNLESSSFYWKKNFHEIIGYVSQEFQLEENRYWSYDTFVYEENQACFLYGGSEINYRRTMGGVLLDLIALFSLEKYFVVLKLLKGSNLESDFNKNQARSQLTDIGGYIKLHPFDSELGIVIFYALNESDLKKLQIRLGLL